MVSYDGSNYKEYAKDTWPNNDDYIYNKAECIDNNGELVADAISFSPETKTATMITDKSIYCTLYFDETLIGRLREDDPNNTLSTDIVGDMYRYQGLNEQYQSDDLNYPVVDNNYICFGTNNKEACLNDEEKYMYRIIGITKDKELKLIKETFLKDDDDNYFFVWNAKYRISTPYNGTGDCDGEKCEWPNTLLFKRINGISNGNSKGASGDTNIFVGTTTNASSYDYLNTDSEWYKMIKSNNWMYGDTFTNENDVNSFNGNKMYRVEHGLDSTTTYLRDENGTENVLKNVTWEKSKDAKIGLMYIHDYYYAWPDENLNKENLIKTWIFFQNNNFNQVSEYELLIDRFGYNTSGGSSGILAACVYKNGEIGSHWSYNATHSVRPVFYTVPNIKIANGKGLKNNPYIVEIKKLT